LCRLLSTIWVAGSLDIGCFNLSLGHNMEAEEAVAEAPAVAAVMALAEEQVVAAVATAAVEEEPAAIAGVAPARSPLQTLTRRRGRSFPLFPQALPITSRFFTNSLRVPAAL
jgi:hypothetical protein